MRNEEKITEALRLSKEEVHQAIKAGQRCFSDENIKTYRKAYAEQLTLERELAALRNEEHAIPESFPLYWDSGAPLPFVFSSEHKTIVTFYLKEVDPSWDGTYVTVKNPADDVVESIGLVEFKSCCSFRFGSPNDEVHEGHPLHGRGLDSYTAQRVVNSSWIRGIQKINSVHYCYRPEYWQKYNHYVFWFHDTTLECIAESYSTECFQGSMRELMPIINERLLH